ncbi:hypothetical protein KUCAC02_007192, partial [Chaenocephalus aceratus]
RVAVVHNNASNTKLCTETLKKELEKWGNIQGVYCSGHATAVQKYSPKTGQNTSHSCGCQESQPSITKKADRTRDLTADQWKLAQETAEVLGPLITLTELLSQEENVSLSATMQMLFNLKRRHLSLEEDDSPAIREHWTSDLSNNYNSSRTRRRTSSTLRLSAWLNIYTSDRPFGRWKEGRQQAIEKRRLPCHPHKKETAGYADGV